ncbi:MAG: MBL fold metallo-hydrolase [Pseudomonadota bacterium]|nr:MBL fold metallo-hydrolase [Pseudomonadota bacterium]
MYTIHHLNCGTLCPWGGSFVDGYSDGLHARLVCHCLLIETDEGLVLVDTGFGARDVAEPHPRLSSLFTTILRPRLLMEETALAQVHARGFRAEDVRHIVLTHLDFDHAGGIADFPHALVHLLADELDAAGRREGLVARGRYRPDQWNADVRWRPYRAEGEPWFGFPAVRAVDGLPPDILLIPLAGHTAGHAGVAVRGRDRWMLHAGDAYFFRDELDPKTPACTPGLAAYQSLMEVDPDLRKANQARLRELSRHHGGDVRIFCAHDAIELEGRGRAIGARRPARVLEPA